MNEPEKEIKKHIIIPELAVVGIILLVIVIYLFGINRDWFPAMEKPEIPIGLYVLEGTDSAIEISENQLLRFVNFDLNASMNEWYGIDLNERYLDRDVPFDVNSYKGSIYAIRLDGEYLDLMQLLYFYREHTICLQFPEIDIEYVFSYQEG